MDTGYEMEPERVGRTRSRRVPALVGTAVLVLAVVIAKPWTNAQPQPAKQAPDLLAVTASARPTATRAATTAPEATPAAVPTWPVPPGPLNGPTLISAQAEGVLPMLDVRRGTWGIGVIGVGPRLSRDATWVDWSAIEPEVVEGPAQDGLARHVLIWPGTGVCTGVPVTDDHPTIVAVTLPVDIRRGANVGDGWSGWWTDGGRTASIDDSVTVVAMRDESGIAAIERIDRTPWPIGRYEFQLRTGDRTFDLTVCLTRPEY